MTNKEFFIKTLDDESPRFRKAIEALADAKHSHKVHERSREAGSLASQLVMQWAAMSDIVTKGNVSWEENGPKMNQAQMLEMFDKNVAKLKQDVEAISDVEWETGEAKMGEMWTTQKYWMTWGFLFDLIHHRGQLTTFLRQMGEKVPSIYGPSADEQ